ncbi:hypothetical protein N7495_000804 [Penicillium taxi]|uniref:uncharacterized protein n=1 Tax=Penicillium taxi TaxID=168475 RepID=UPI002544FEC8|nr:uncharacterized protein N7495_000804 [Penicillium taxi]KAJ5908122.1 hypothetical protein N7495_000804 [Penicillium taxi]
MDSAPASAFTKEKTFSSYNEQQGKAYAQARPDYHPSLYETVINHHTSTGGQLETLLDLGCGPGNVARAIGTQFTHAIGLDPSVGMIATARSLGGKTSTSEPIRFEVATAEDQGANLSPPIQDASVDLITAANAAHWFDMSLFWLNAARVLKPGGSVALWVSGRLRLDTSVPNAAAIQAALDVVEEEDLSPFFTDGNLMTRNRYADLLLPWTLEQPVPQFDEGSFFRKNWDTADDFFAYNTEVNLDTFELLAATTSPVTRWREAHPDLCSTENDVIKKSRIMIERLQQEAGVEKGKESIKVAMQGAVLIIKKRD